MDQAMLNNFVKWCKNNGMEFDLVEPVFYGHDRGVGLRAKHSIRWNERFLGVS
jgi:hypothetical protein